MSCQMSSVFVHDRCSPANTSGTITPGNGEKGNIVEEGIGNNTLLTTPLIQQATDRGSPTPAIMLQEWSPIDGLSVDVVPPLSTDDENTVKYVMSPEAAKIRDGFIDHTCEFEVEIHYQNIDGHKFAIHVDFRSGSIRFDVDCYSSYPVLQRACRLIVLAGAKNHVVEAHAGLRGTGIRAYSPKRMRKVVEAMVDLLISYEVQSHVVYHWVYHPVSTDGSFLSGKLHRVYFENRLVEDPSATVVAYQDGIARARFPIPRSATTDHTITASECKVFVEEIANQFGIEMDWTQTELFEPVLRARGVVRPGALKTQLTALRGDAAAKYCTIKLFLAAGYQKPTDINVAVTTKLSNAHMAACAMKIIASKYVRLPANITFAERVAADFYEALVGIIDVLCGEKAVKKFLLDTVLVSYKKEILDAMGGLASVNSYVLGA